MYRQSPQRDILPLPRPKRPNSGILGKPYTPYALRAVLDGVAVWLDGGSSRPFLKR